MEYVFVHSDRFESFSAYEDYPWSFSRSRATYELCIQNGLIEREGVSVQEPKEVDEEALLSYHTPGYLALLKEANRGTFREEMLERGVGTLECPVYKGCYDYHKLTVGATLKAVESVVDRNAHVAFSPTGGLHHAGPDFASGFCYLNDVNIAISLLLQRGLRILCIDIDAHHGDLVQETFYKDERVLTISFHETTETLFPWKGGTETEIGEGKARGFNVNVPLLEGTGDETFVWAFKRVFPPLCEAFRPDLVIAIIGADSLFSDTMSHLRLTNNGYLEAVEEIARRAPRLIALGCGGYVLNTLARAWTLAWAVMTRVQVGGEESLLFGGTFWGDGLLSLKDRPVFIPEGTRKRGEAHCQRIVRFIEKEVFPIHGISP